MITSALEAIIESIPAAVLAVDRDLCIRFANPKAHELFAPETLRSGEPLPAAPFDGGFATFTRNLVNATGNPIRRLVELPQATYVILGIPPRDADVAAIYVDDVTSQVRRDRAQREFVANAAHELLTPLTGIASAAHVLESGAKEVPELRDRFIDHIARECSRLTRLARGLLVLARAQSGQETVRTEAVELRPLIDDVVASVAPEGTKVDCDERLAVWADRDLAETALSNLVANSVRHSSDGNVSITAELNGDRVAVIVENAGTAIAADTARLHDRFVSGDGDDNAGFGLGISIATEALHVMGATLTFDFGNDSTGARVELAGERM